MSRTSVLLAAITSEPTTTSDLYDRIGYPALTRVGLIPYRAFRAELLKLSAAGLASSEQAPDGSTVWWREEPDPATPSAPSGA
ncbi:MAG TPA: hypothetical protein VE571_11780 [Solirubrobacteraceae bacterium]|nr:hypothetical protein [Solirubrobacteraceae bacterium]